MAEDERKIIEMINRSKNKEKAIKVALELLMSLLAAQETKREYLPEAS